MRAVVVIACLGLVTGERTAVAAEPTYRLTVSRHPSVDKLKFSEDKVKKLLRDASEVMHKAGCPVTFELKGDILLFSRPAPGKIVTEGDLKAVHSESADVKIVEEIHCCVSRRERRGGRFEGCSWPPDPPSHSIILTESGAMLGNRWAHEFGHRMGLPHRDQDTDKIPLMTGGGVTDEAFQLNDHECDCFRHPGSCELSKIAPPLKPGEMACATTR